MCRHVGGLEIPPIRSYECWSACVFFICFTRSYGAVGPGFPAGVFVAQFDVFPQAFEFKFVLGA